MYRALKGGPELLVAQSSSITAGTARTIRPRPFERWNSSLPLPCFNGGLSRSRAHAKGFIFIKIPKCASTTGASVTLRIAQNVARKQQHGDEMCLAKTNHDLASKIMWSPNETFVWSIIREPTARTISHFFFDHVSRKNLSSTDASFIGYLQEKRNYTNYYRRLSKSLARIDDPIDDINMILDAFNFIGISERMEESVVALKMLLGLETSDVLYLSSKESGKYDDGKYKNQNLCHLIQKSYVSNNMKHYFSSPEYKSSIAYDELLYQAVNHSLDMTIEMLGVAEFENQLREFRVAKARIDEACSSVKFPCTKDGVKRANEETDCLEGDWGCGFDCIDSTIETEELWHGTVRPNAITPSVLYVPKDIDSAQ